MAGDIRFSNSLVRLKVQGKAPRLNSEKSSLEILCKHISALLTLKLSILFLDAIFIAEKSAISERAHTFSVVAFAYMRCNF